MHYVERSEKMRTNFGRLRDSMDEFSGRITNLKVELNVDFQWYPYATLPNIVHIDPLVTKDLDPLFKPRGKYADIGAADGDLAFYLESMGHDCDIYDNAPTNMNGLRGAYAIKRALNSSVNVIQCDLDTQFDVPHRYDLIFFLGILYHLKNPFFVLEKLSSMSRYMIISTRIARHFGIGHGDVSAISAAYLVAPHETNNDPTNFWIFTDAGLKRIISRAGWDVVSYHTLGDTAHSNPRDSDHDERAFAILRSRAGDRGNRYSRIE
jgi:tRNA (mo5U34)-methyltransferase